MSYCKNCGKNLEDNLVCTDCNIDNFPNKEININNESSNNENMNNQNMNNQNMNTSTNQYYTNTNIQNNNVSSTFFQSKNIFALLGFIFSCLSLFIFISAIPGIVLGIIGIFEAKKLNGYGKGMSLVAIILPIAMITFVVVLSIAFYLAIFLISFLSFY
ncbi:MAG: DUF4190 domain-containing protein [Anaeroplasmataceae bacterium]